MKQRALIDIDMLLDTRYGTLRRMDPALAEALVGSNQYRSRNTDRFDLLSNGCVDQNKYEELYRNRDVETLFMSRMTDFLYFLRMDVKRAVPEIARGVEVGETSFDINLYPYDLLPEEAETIRRSIARYIPTLAEVNVVNITPEELTPARVDLSYEMIAYYNHEDWLRHHSEALLKKPIPTNVLLTPRIATSGEVPSSDPDLKDPFLCRSAVLVKFLGLHFLPIYYACWNPMVLQNLEKLKESQDSGSK